MPSVAICECTEGPASGPHCPLLLYAGGIADHPEIAVQAEQYSGAYELTDYYVDGVRGISDAAIIEAEVDESPTCAECTASISRWDHS